MLFPWTNSTNRQLPTTHVHPKLEGPNAKAITPSTQSRTSAIVSNGNHQRCEPASSSDPAPDGDFDQTPRPTGISTAPPPLGPVSRKVSSPMLRVPAKDTYRLSRTGHRAS